MKSPRQGAPPERPVFDPQQELCWLRELVASPLWGELSAPQQQRWLHQLDLLSRQQDRP